MQVEQWHRTFIAWSYIAFKFSWGFFVFGLLTYVIFILDHSGWWYLLLFIIGGGNTAKRAKRFMSPDPWPVKEKKNAS